MMNGFIEKYSLGFRTLHWLMAVVILGLIASGWWMASLSKDVPYKYEIFFWHKSFGVLALILVALRIFLKLVTKQPSLPNFVPLWKRMTARTVQFFLYALMVALPVSGVFMSMSSGRDVPFFGLTLPNLMEQNHDLAAGLHQFHVNMPYLMLFLIAIHVAGALASKFSSINRDKDLFDRML